jgi:hypothetical protein
MINNLSDVLDFSFAVIGRLGARNGASGCASSRLAEQVLDEEDLAQRHLRRGACTENSVVNKF